eukprot:GHVS01026266.1.p1 GENE.GHVS01026266.1~~GHVS01026266.1.p1  ORF type:complete len:124 (-),score=35.88 GHVS01026266.1:45-416(-)
MHAHTHTHNNNMFDQTTPTREHSSSGCCYCSSSSSSSSTVINIDYEQQLSGNNTTTTTKPFHLLFFDHCVIHTCVCFLLFLILYHHTQTNMTNLLLCLGPMSEQQSRTAQPLVLTSTKSHPQR